MPKVLDSTEPTKRQLYYRKRRKHLLAISKRRYHENAAYREATKVRARQRYQNDPQYARATIERAKARYRKLHRMKRKMTTRQSGRRTRP